MPKAPQKSIIYLPNKLPFKVSEDLPGAGTGTLGDTFREFLVTVKTSIIQPGISILGINNSIFSSIVFIL